jgi:hypothetical protein
MATPNVAAAKPRSVVTFKRDNLRSAGTADSEPSVAEVAALEVLAVERLTDVGRVHARSVARCGDALRRSSDTGS